ncbi:MAG TPA: GNAT family N-acetyltransferase, partial [Solirubrobacterales bacterium]|nr:GNAT family N-acetyltransferase [Solirubrobacterales bacterium]
PTSRPAWLRAWWKAGCGAGESAARAPRVVVVTEGERLVGLLPAYLVDSRARAPDLRLIGASTFWSVAPLVASDAPPATIGELSRALGGTSPAPSRLEIPSAPADAAWPGELRRGWPGAPAWLRRGNRGALLVVEGHESAEAWFAALPKRLRSDHLRRNRKRAEAGLEVVPTTDPEAVAADLHALAELHRARWGGASSWLVEGVEEALVAAGRELIEEGGWRLWKVVRGEQILAATLFARGGAVSEMLLTAYDLEWSHLAPGVATVVAGIEHELDSGARVVDFGHGGFEYLRRMASAEVPIVNCELFPGNRRMPLALAAWLVPHGRERLNIWRKRLRLGQRLRGIRRRRHR